MGLIVQVGDPSEFLPPPPRFPTCGNWDFPDLDQEAEVLGGHDAMHAYSVVDSSDAKGEKCVASGGEGLKGVTGLCVAVVGIVSLVTKRTGLNN